MSGRTPYSGTSRKLVLAFDVGTTYSGISYSILDPGQVPEIRGVTRYPAQELVGGDSKIPTVLYYNKNGIVCAAGAETIGEGVQLRAEEEGWTKAEWFKLHLRPKKKSSAHVTSDIPPLPRNKTALDVFADFLRYLYICAKTFITETHPNGSDLWKSLINRTEFVLTHPNGWEGAQQSQMRKTAVIAGLIPDTDEGQARLTFVTEGEASLHFCIRNGLTSAALKNGGGVVIVDAGGGTIDVSSYAQTGVSFEEIAEPQCHFKGSIFVTRQAHIYLKKYLEGSRFSSDVENMKNIFDKTTKLRFRNSNEPQYIKFGSFRDKDVDLNIRSGQLKLPGADVAAFFKPSIDCMIDAVLKEKRSATKSISSVFLVGGFAASEWLFTQLKSALEPVGINVCRPDSHVNKAVADGAVSFQIDHFVGARVAKFAYGLNCSTEFKPFDPEHVKRYHMVYKGVSGVEKIHGHFSCILPRRTKVQETKEFRRSFRRESLDKFFDVSDDILCFQGDGNTPEWVDVERDHFSVLCSIETNMSHISRSVISSFGIQHYKVDYDIILMFGMTELKAQLCWKENGIEKRSPAKVVYDPVALGAELVL